MSARSRAAGRALSVAVVAVLVLLAGCARIPDSGHVRQVEPVAATEGEDSVIEQPDVLLLPPEPVPGLRPQQVLRGFLLASAASDADHAVARQYLTPEAAARWDDGAEAVVHDPAQLRVTCEGDPTGTCQGADTLVVTGQREAVLDRGGSYRPDPGPFEDRYGLARVDGEWRLSEVPDGVRLTPADVARAYRPVSLAFLDPTGDLVVPDRVFLPVVSRSLPRLLVDALLTGPSARLAPAVTTAFPQGTRLRRVTLEGGVVLVDLSPQVLRADDDARRALSAQLVTTLRQVPDVTGLRVLVEGEPLEVPGAPATQPMDSWSAYDRDLVPAGVPGYHVMAGAVRPLPRPGAPPREPLAVGLRHPAVDLEEERVAGLRPDGAAVQLWTGAPSGLVPRLRAPDLVPPSFGGGRYGVWTARPGPDPEVLLVRALGDPVTVPAPELAGLGPLRVLRVSRDDTRVALVVGEGVETRLYAGLVVPDRSTPAGVRLAGLRRLAPGLSDVQDVRWADNQRVAVLARSAAAPAVWLVQSDGSVVEPQAASGLPEAPTGIATAPGHPLLLESAGQVWEVRDGAAVAAAPGEDPFYPG